MACIVEIKDIKDTLTKELLKVKGVSKTPQNLFYTYTLADKKDYSKELTEVLNALRGKFHTDVYREIINTAKSDYGIDIDLVPTQELADALTEQNFRDEQAMIDEIEEEERRKRDGGRQLDLFGDLESRFNTVEDFADTKTPIADTPIIDNYVQLLNHKQNKLEETELKVIDLNNKINSLKAITQNKERLQEIKQNQEKLKVLRGNVNKLKDQITLLSENEVEFMFHAVTKDVEDIRQELDSSSIDTIANVKEKIEFLETFLKGVIDYSRSSEYKNEYDSLVTDIQELLVDYEQKRKDKNLLFLAENPAVKKTLENLNQSEKEKEAFGKEKDPNTNVRADFTVEDLLKVDKDINVLEAGVFGQNSNASPNTIIPPYLLSLYSKVEYQKLQKVNILKDRLKAFNKRTNMLDREFLFGRDAAGRKTGFLVDLFSEEWYEEKNKIGRLVSGYYKASRLDKLSNYNKIISFLNNNTETIDFTKLSAIKNSFGGAYGKYFTHSQADMDTYEAKLRKKLGPLYDNHIQQIETKLEEYEQLKNETLTNGGSQRRLAQENIWEFNKNWSVGKQGAISYTYNMEGVDYTSDVLFSNFKAITTIPLEETVDIHTGELVNSGFYDKDFDMVKNDSNNSELWSIYREMSSYIESRYSTIPYTGRMSYPKFENELIEQIRENWDGVKKVDGDSAKQGGKLLHSLMHSWKGTYYEKGRFSVNDNKVNPNYVDTSKKLIADKIDVYKLQGYTEAEAKSLATGETLENYSSDLDVLFETLLSEAAIHDARTEVEPIAKSLFEEFVDIKDKDNRTRKNAVSKLASWIDVNIYNQNSENAGRDSGTMLGSIDFESSPTGNKVTKILDIAAWVQEYAGNKISATDLKYLQGIQKTKLYSDTEKELLKSFESLKGKPFSLKNYKVNSGGYNLVVETTTVIDESGQEAEVTYYKVAGEVVDKADFETEFDNYLDYKVKSLGLDLTAHGVLDGILKSIIMSGLGLGIVSGNFNRLEGMMTNMINDDGTYFTEGNTQVAKEILSFANFNRYLDDTKQAMGKVFGITPTDKKSTVLKSLDTSAITALLLQKLNVIQDRKNELQKNRENKFKLGSFLFRWSVDDPEFKNQATIVLSVLMDSFVTNDKGEKVHFLDTDTKEYNVYSINEDGELQFKEGFENFDLASEEMAEIVVNIQNVISKMQGNYNERDKIKAKNHVIGRSALLMKGWLPEHYRQRWNPVNKDTSKGLNIDLISTQKKQSGGRYMEVLHSDAPEIFIARALGTAAFGYFGFGVAGLLGTSIFGVLAARALYKRIASKQPLERDVSGLMELIKFFQLTILETLNFPGKILSSFGGKYIAIDNYVDRDASENVLLNPFKGHTKTDAQIRAIKGMAKELALMTMFLSLKMAAAALLFNGDDDEDSKKRKFYNFMQNQLTRMYRTFDSWSNPYTLVGDNGFISVVGYLESFLDILVALNKGEYDKASQASMKVVGIPSVAGKYLSKGETFYETAYIADTKQGAVDTEPMQWFYEWTKDRSKTEEELAKDEYLELRRESGKEFEEQILETTSNKHVKKAIVDAIKEYEIGKKDPKKTYVETNELLKEGKKISKTKNDYEITKKLREKLKELDLDSKEINKAIEDYNKIKQKRD